MAISVNKKHNSIRVSIEQAWGMLEEISEKNFTPEGRIEIFHREIDESFPGAKRKRERG